jgi:hypothetical protein
LTRPGPIRHAFGFAGHRHRVCDIHPSSAPLRVSMLVAQCMGSSR